MHLFTFSRLKSLPCPSSTHFAGQLAHVIGPLKCYNDDYQCYDYQCYPRFTLSSAFHCHIRVLPSHPRFTLISVFYPLVRPSVCPDIRPSIRPDIRPSVHPSRPSFRPSVRPPIRPSVRIRVLPLPTRVGIEGKIWERGYSGAITAKVVAKEALGQPISAWPCIRHLNLPPKKRVPFCFQSKKITMPPLVLFIISMVLPP